MKVKRCPICMQELPNKDAICQYCGKIYYQIEGAKLFEREHKKNVAFNHQLLYVTEYYFAFDKDGDNGSLMTLAGARGFGLAGALAGAIADTTVEAVGEVIKRKSTAICYNWKDIADLSYPMKPMRYLHINVPVDTGIDVRLKDDTELIVLVNKKFAKDVYDVMHMLHCKSVQMSTVNQDKTGDPGCGNSQEAGSRILTKRIKPVSYTGTSVESRPDFFKCPHCGVTQMREGDACSYCGKPVPGVKLGMPLTVPMQQPGAETRDVLGQQHISGRQDDQRACPSCGTMQEAGNKFCVRCGQKLMVDRQREKFCPHCGVKVMEGMLFCGECGTKLR